MRHQRTAARAFSWSLEMACLSFGSLLCASCTRCCLPAARTTDTRTRRGGGRGEAAVAAARVWRPPRRYHQHTSKREDHADDSGPLVSPPLVSVWTGTHAHAHKHACTITQLTHTCSFSALLDTHPRAEEGKNRLQGSRKRRTGGVRERKQEKRKEKKKSNK